MADEKLLTDVDRHVAELRAVAAFLDSPFADTSEDRARRAAGTLRHAIVVGDALRARLRGETA